MTMTRTKPNDDNDNYNISNDYDVESSLPEDKEQWKKRIEKARIDEDSKYRKRVTVSVSL